MEDIIIVGILAVILTAIALYLYKAKQKGKKCIGCPYADCCSAQNKCGCEK